MNLYLFIYENFIIFRNSLILVSKNFDISIFKDITIILVRLYIPLIISEFSIKEEKTEFLKEVLKIYKSKIGKYFLFNLLFCIFSVFILSLFISTKDVLFFFKFIYILTYFSVFYFVYVDSIRFILTVKGNLFDYFIKEIINKDLYNETEKLFFFRIFLNDCKFLYNNGYKNEVEMLFNIYIVKYSEIDSFCYEYMDYVPFELNIKYLFSLIADKNNITVNKLVSFKIGIDYTLKSLNKDKNKTLLFLWLLKGYLNELDYDKIKKLKSKNIKLLNKIILKDIDNVKGYNGKVEE